MARVSILIPNYNNGRQSSKSGQRDFLGDLLRSLQETLESDPVPVEIIIADDGSTDDSLETASAWSRRTWAQGGGGLRPFCTLIEREHCGVLSIVANCLMDAAQGEFCCRLDGDIVVQTKHWASELVRIFREGPRDLAVVGPKQLDPNGRIHAMGDWILHPRGYHHIAQGADRSAITRAIECDHVMGCFYCLKREVWDEVGRYDENILRGQTIDYGLRVRKAGWRTWCVPSFEFTHYHGERGGRANRADSDEGVLETLDRFQKKWGFHRVAPDLDEVREKYSGTPLLWNAQVFGPRVEHAAHSIEKPLLPQTAWGRYADDLNLQGRLNAQATLTEQMLAVMEVAEPVVANIGAGDGMLCHLLAQRGIAALGTERNAGLAQLANEIVGRATYDGARPQYFHQTASRDLPLESACADLVLLLHTLEAHPNPVRLMREIDRVLRPNGRVLIMSTIRVTATDFDADRVHLYRPFDLAQQLRYIGFTLREFPRPVKINGVMVCEAIRSSEKQALEAAEAARKAAAPTGASAFALASAT